MLPNDTSLIVEYKYKLSIAAKKRMAALSKDERRAIMAKAREKAFIPETIAKANASRAHLPGANLGRKWSDEVRANMRKGKQAYCLSEASLEWRAKLAATSKGRRHSKESRDLMTQRQKASWDKLSKEERAERAKNWTIAGRTRQKTRIEYTVEMLLTAIGISFEREHRIGTFLADFFIPSKNLIIECDGEYWHSRPGAKERDARRDTWMIERGYKVLRFSEQQINQLTQNELYGRVSCF